MDKEKNETETVEDMIKKLKKSPLYAMSLGGRELYHSNFWAWLMKKDKKFINVFFNDINFENAEITREENDHDLTIKKDGKIYIIENKIKSLATKEQLNRYSLDIIKWYINSITKKNQSNISVLRFLFDKCGITTEQKEGLLAKKPYLKDNLNNTTAENSNIALLTGLPSEGPNFIQDSIWSYMSYSNISEKIKEIAYETSNLTEDERNIVFKYCDDVKRLSCVIDNLLKESKDKYSFKLADAKKYNLKDIRFDDTYKKLKMEDFAKTVNLDTIDEKVKDKDGFELKKVVEFSNKHAILTVKYEYEKRKKTGRKCDRYAIGIQIEEYAFRYFVEAPELATKTCSKNKSDLEEFQKLADAGWFISKDSKNKFHGNDLASEGDPCNKYEPNFIYQHYKLNKGKKYSDVRGKIYQAFESDAFFNAFKIIKDM